MELDSVHFLSGLGLLSLLAFAYGLTPLRSGAERLWLVLFALAGVFWECFELFAAAFESVCWALYAFESVSLLSLFLWGGRLWGFRNGAWRFRLF